MGLHFIFPSHPIRSTEVEEMFSDQFGAFQAAGYSVSLCPDSVIQENKTLRNIPAGSTVVYRGWMLNTKEYARLTQAIVDALSIPLTSKESYLTTHHLPNWYPLITDFTPETRIFEKDANWEVELRALGWDAFFIKDYVKSLKTSRGSIVRDPSEIGQVVAEMEKYRGEIEGGLCIRRVEPFITDTERRYFVLDGKAFSSDQKPCPEIVNQVASRIPSSFFSIDVIERKDGVQRIVEVGDGQVSDLVGWSEASFVELWKTMRPSK